MPRLVDSRLALLEALAGQAGPAVAPIAAPGGDPPFEAVIRVALGLVAEPRVASAAFDALRDAAMLEPGDLAGVDPLELDDVFRQAGIRLASKALGPLRRIARWAEEKGLNAEGWRSLVTEAIRDDWRGLSGVGPATTDSLLLFAIGRPTIPVDRASFRILVRHGWLDPSSDYDEARSVLESIAPDDVSRLGQLSIGLEKVGRDHCKPSAPKCERCPLRPLLPEGGPVEVD